uniref:Uncharacterized protein n=1 Tax=viral metagenome TaxID=1070528 RepID=A0A6C0K0A1_9ZZZZ
MAQNISVIIVDKSASLKSLTIKDYKEDELYKKCGFKKADGFVKQTEWGVKMEGKKYVVAVFAKTEGRANTENKYDFPPPVDTVLFFGSCALVCSVKKDEDVWELSSLSLELWEKIYEKLFGGFEDLAATCGEDEEEEDELESIPASKKTKQGYLKDGFVVDSESSDDKEEYGSDEDDEQEEDESEEQEDVLEIEDIGSELSEEEYESSSEDDEA